MWNETHFDFALEQKCCLDSCLVYNFFYNYQATVKTQESTETYIGLTANEFKTRWRNHKTSFNNEKKKNDTELSKYVWQLKDRYQEYDIIWKIVARAKALLLNTVTSLVLSPWRNV